MRRAYNELDKAIQAAKVDARKVERLVMFGNPVEIEVAFRLLLKKHEELEEDEAENEG